MNHLRVKSNISLLYIVNPIFLKVLFLSDLETHQSLHESYIAYAYICGVKFKAGSPLTVSLPSYFSLFYTNQTIEV